MHSHTTMISIAIYAVLCWSYKSFCTMVLKMIYMINTTLHKWRYWSLLCAYNARKLQYLYRKVRELRESADSLTFLYRHWFRAQNCTYGRIENNPSKWRIIIFIKMISQRKAIVLVGGGGISGSILILWVQKMFACIHNRCSMCFNLHCTHVLYISEGQFSLLAN